jgi:glycine cleavage system regulatory protein
MTMTSEVATLRITRDLKQFEDAIDAAIAAQCALGATLAKARIETGAPAVSGHVAMMRLAKAGQMLVSARADAIRAHEDLYQVGKERGDLLTEPKPEGSLERFEEAAAA